MREKDSRTFDEVQSVMKNKLDEIVRHAAQKMITAAIGIELSEFMKRHSNLTTDKGQQAIVRNGYHKERLVTVNAGTVNVKIPRTRNRLGGENFQSSLVPRYFKRSLTIDSAVPLLYLKGISTNDMESALKSLFGNSVEGLSAANVSRLKSIWINICHYGYGTTVNHNVGSGTICICRNNYFVAGFNSKPSQD